uniref:Uncharacterized protein n=1 Tax=Vespula pensylvanica TaxID=30213 RepID=A0A834PBN3_VESPE|nr:hypothetical protein H0235_003189 [Vespula pensylvanica]
MSMLDVTDIAISFSVSIPFPKHRGLVQKHIHGRPSRHGWGGNRYSRLPACLPTLRRTLNVSPLAETPPPTSPTSAYALHRPMDKGEEEKRAASYDGRAASITEKQPSTSSLVVNHENKNPCDYRKHERDVEIKSQLREASVAAGGFSVDDFLAVYSSRSASWLQHVAEIGSRASSNHPTDPYRSFPIFPECIVALERQNLKLFNGFTVRPPMAMPYQATLLQETARTFKNVIGSGSKDGKSGKDNALPSGPYAGKSLLKR